MSILKKFNKNKEKNKNEEVTRVVLTDRAIEIVLDLFEDINDALLYGYIYSELRNHKYQRPDRVIRDLINDGILQIDKFEPEMYLALTEYGEGLWEEMYE